jgi:putative oxidoreductase
MPAPRWMVWLERLSRWSLAGIFLAAAVPKILDPAGFALDITHYAMVPDVLVNPMAIALPWIEAVGALALLTGFAAEGGLLLINLLILAFMAGLGQAWVRGLDIDCGCFGHSDAKGHVGLAFLRDIGFLALGVLASWLRRRRFKTPAF